MKNNDDNRLRMAVIAGATQALKYMNKNRRATEDEIIKHIADNATSIVEGIDDPL